MNDKPNGQEAGWRLLHSEQIFQNGNMTLRRDQVNVKGEETFHFAYVERALAVLIVPVTRDGQMVLIRQYRYALDEWCWEIPAGGCHDTGDTPPEAVARKELYEEVGGTCSRLEHITTFYSAPSSTDELCHVYLAHEVELSSEAHLELTESIETHLVPVAEALELARSGGMKTGPCALSVLLCENALRQFLPR